MGEVDRQRADLIIFLCFLAIISFGLVFRNAFNHREGVQFIADTLGNTGGVIVASFLFFWLSGESTFRARESIVLYVGIGFIIYEFLQILLPWQTFDIKDIWGTFIGIVLASIINVITIGLGRYKR